MLRCGRSIVFMKGYRSVDGQQHKTIIELSGDVLGEKFKNIIKKFDHMRRKRNQFTYDPFLPVSKIEAENALKTAEEFVKIVLKLVQKENPQLRFNFNKSRFPMSSHFLFSFNFLKLAATTATFSFFCFCYIGNIQYCYC